MLQMSDVRAGGATVFTDIGASVSPKKVRLLFKMIIIISDYLSGVLIPQFLIVPAGVSGFLV